MALVAVLLFGASLTVAACFAAYTQPQAARSDTTSTLVAEVRQQAASTITVTSPPATPTEPATPTSTMTPTTEPTITASPTHSMTEGQAITMSTGVTVWTELPLAEEAAKLSALLALTITQSITRSAGFTGTASLSGTMSISDTTAEASESLTGTVAVSDDLLLLVPTPTPVSPAPPAPTPDAVARVAQMPILMYHYVSVPPADADIYRLDLSVTPERFGEHLDRMAADGYTTISMVDLLNHLVLDEPLPEKPVLITFDDGYRDNHENAFPLLAERDMTATFFVVTDFIDEERPEYFTWDMLREMHEAGMSIESHGRNHVSLKGKDVDYLVWQALGSLEAIERELGRRPRFVSYPAGQYDRLAMDIFKSADYWAGLTTVQGATHDSENLFELRRVRVRGSTTPDELSRLLELDW